MSDGWQAAMRRRKKHSAFAIALAVVIVLAVISVVGGASDSNGSLPSCEAHTTNCRQTSDDYWVPLWYYGALSRAQGTSGGAAPSTAGTQPTSAQLRDAGATSEEADEAESYSDSDGSSDGSDDSGSGDDSSDDSGDDGGGGDGGD